MLSPAMTPARMFRSMVMLMLIQKLFSENKPAGIVHPGEENALGRPQSNLSTLKRGL